MAITHVRQIVRVSGVEDVIVTDISDPDVNGIMMRAIRIMGPDESLLFELQIESEDAEKIKIPAPTTLDF